MTVELELRAARVRYGPLEALHGVDLLVPAAALTVLTGRNGSGRTTVLRALAGAVPLAHGRVLWRGEDVTRLPAHARARRGLAHVPAERATYEGLSVAENLELAARDGDPRPALDAYPPLRALLRRRAGTLSGGEQRMLAVSRALLTRARVLLLDEPVRGMSPSVADRTYALLRDSGAAVVTAEQRLPSRLDVHRSGAPVLVYELRRGAVVFRGEPGEPSPEPAPESHGRPRGVRPAPGGRPE
ncbi:ABC transporter ATP-binding protein [Streptomyces sp. NPDC050504]|uniref:ABC transporter ATP-binding protein n=1 Tax=Streptomyces sp. NPDC050504 TaxID=3365618 RepID=UPI0037BB3CEA